MKPLHNYSSDPIVIGSDHASIAIVPANKTKNPQTKKRNNLKRFNRQSTSLIRIVLLIEFMNPKSKKIILELSLQQTVDCAFGA